MISETLHSHERTPEWAGSWSAAFSALMTYREDVDPTLRDRLVFSLVEAVHAVDVLGIAIYQNERFAKAEAWRLKTATEVAERHFAEVSRLLGEMAEKT